jgi:hypothetical protein
MLRSKPLCPRAIAILAMLLLVCAQALALVHRVAHAQTSTPTTVPALASAYAVAQTGDGVAEQSCADGFFSHERGLACLDFDAALGLDTTASASMPSLLFGEPSSIEICFASSPRAVPTRGFFLARAPPRA